MDRRDFLSGLGGLVVGAGAGLAAGEERSREGPGLAGEAPPGPTPGPPLEGTVFLIGPQGRRHPEGMRRWLAQEDQGSVLVEVDLATEATRTTWVEVSKGHSVLPLADDHLLIVGHHGPHCVVLDPDRKVARRMGAREGYVYGGHARVVPELGAVIVPARRKRVARASDTGEVEVYPLELTGRPERYDSGGVHPHEVRLLPGGKQLVITHYGDRTGGSESRPLTFPEPWPALTVMDAATLEVVRKIPFEAEAILTHMDVAPDGMVYAVSNQYLRANEEVSKQELLEELRRRSPAHLVDGEWADFSQVRRRLPIFSGFVRIDPGTGDVKMLPTHGAKRSQSVAVNQATGVVAATYMQGGHVLLARASEGRAPLISRDYGLVEIRGVADLRGTPYIALNGHHRGLAVVHAETGAMARRFPLDTYVSPHLEYRA
jgi:hypothetical protein